MLRAPAPLSCLTAQGDLFRNSPQSGTGNRSVLPKTTIAKQLKQPAEKSLRCALLQNESWEKTADRGHYLFVYSTHDKPVTQSTLKELAHKILRDDLGITGESYAIDFRCSPHNTSAMMIRVPAAVLESKCDEMAEKLKALVATVVPTSRQTR